MPVGHCPPPIPSTDEGEKAKVRWVTGRSAQAPIKGQTATGSSQLCLSQTIPALLHPPRPCSRGTVRTSAASQGIDLLRGCVLVRCRAGIQTLECWILKQVPFLLGSHSLVWKCSGRWGPEPCHCGFEVPRGNISVFFSSSLPRGGCALASGRPD